MRVTARRTGYVRAVPLFRRRRPDPPEWASLFSPDEWHAFAELVRYEAGRRRWEEHVHEGLVRAGDVPMGLTNIAQLCHGSPREEWTGLVAQHFVALEDLAGAPPPPFAGVDEARAALKARLLGEAHMPAGGVELAERRVADGLRLVLAFDMPDSVRMPARSDVLEWGEEDELFEIALANTDAEGGALVERHDFSEKEGGPATIWSFTGESFFTATHGLWSAHIEGPHGSVVAVPNRQAVLIHPIRDLAVVNAITIMVGLARRLCADGPGSISEDLYWSRDRTLTLLPVDGDTFTPPDEFVETLNRLGEPGPGGEPPGPDAD